MRRPMRDAEMALYSRDNLFDLVRLCTCGAVIFSHSFALTGYNDPVDTATGFELGTIGVFGLFGLSGYLLAAGWSRPQTLRSFLVKRMLRIWPGLFVSTLVTVFVLGPMVTSLSLGHYLAQAGTYGYVVKHSLLDGFSGTLPGVFTHNPFKDTVNGSLWTIPVEVCCYVALAFAVRFGILSRPRILVGGFVVVLMLMLLFAPPDTPRVLVTGTDEVMDALRNCGAFLAGTLIWVLRDRIPRRWNLVAVAAALAFLPLGDGLHSVLAIIGIPYVVAVVGSEQPRRLGRLTRYGDVTYGAYIYSYPAQQAIAHVIVGIGPLAMMALAYPVSWALGLASWRLIETPAMSLRKRLQGTAAHRAALATDGGLAGDQPLTRELRPGFLQSDVRGREDQV